MSNIGPIFVGIPLSPCVGPLEGLSWAAGFSDNGKTYRLDYQDTTNVDSKGIAFTIRSVFVIDPKKTIRTILSYPASTGRNAAEVLRIVDSLQTGDKHRITTPINWVPGDDVIVHPSVNNELAKELFPDFRIVKPYLRFTPLPKEKVTQ